MYGVSNHLSLRRQNREGSGVEVTKVGKGRARITLLENAKYELLACAKHMLPSSILF